jgi:hypothetical protein
MRRITIEETRAACKATGYRLEQGTTFSPVRECGCPIGILAATMSSGQVTNIDELVNLERAAEKLGLDSWYATGLIDGFDDDDLPTPFLASLHSEYCVGYADGTAIRLALLPAV